VPLLLFSDRRQGRLVALHAARTVHTDAVASAQSLVDRRQDEILFVAVFGRPLAAEDPSKDEEVQGADSPFSAERVAGKVGGEDSVEGPTSFTSGCQL
jgi:hypothetical protein